MKCELKIEYWVNCNAIFPSNNQGGHYESASLINDVFYVNSDTKPIVERSRQYIEENVKFLVARY